MGTGGFIPSNRSQMVTFYNTTGVIEKDKNMYFAPRFEDEDDIVYESFIDKLNAICPPPSDYNAIMLTGWSPEDRTLVVRGNIDDFRVITDTGACLNYLIVKRSITKKLPDESTITNEYYYGFFITGVEQVGGSSVKVSVEPDDFTNVFYLHNSHQITAGEAESLSYEPFNERMKNCYVNRQHYDRVKKYRDYWELEITLSLDNYYGTPEFIIGHVITLEFDDGGVLSGSIRYIDDEDSPVIRFWIRTQTKLDFDEDYSTGELTYEGDNFYFQYDYRYAKWRFTPQIEPTNQRIFLNQEESFKFKYQYRDERRPFGFNEVFSQSQLNYLKDVSSFNNITDVDLKKKILKCCIQYFVIEMKSSEREGRIYYSLTEGDWQYYYAHLVNNCGGFGKESVVLALPFFNVPDVFKKYESAIYGFALYFRVNGSSTALMELPSASKAYAILNSLSLSDFALGAFILNDICIPDDLISFDFIEKRVIFNCNAGFDSTSWDLNPQSQKGLYIVPIDYELEQEDKPNGLGYVVSPMPPEEDSVPSKVVKVGDYCLPMLMPSGLSSRDFSINIYEEKLTGWDKVWNEFIDPVLEAEPYSFYSLSYLAYEMPFNKNRYYEDMIIKFSYIASVNGAIKLSYIPSYKVENKEFKYYNDSMTFIIPSNLPLTSNSYITYYYQNQAQMKNQFAVNDYNRAVDLGQHFFLSGPNAVGMSATKKGWVGAVSETGNQFVQMANEAIDWAQSNKVIEMNQKAKLADMGARPDVVKQSGSDVFFDLYSTENRPYFNHYTIDTVSYNTIAKFLERFGYNVNLYDSLHAIDRVGWNFIKLNSFDWNPQAQYDIMNEQEASIKKIFSEGVTLLHDRDYLYSGHNYEMIFVE